MAETTATICPNCQKPALRTGDTIECENCDAVITITKKQEGRVKNFGKIEDHEKRIQKLEGLVPSEEPQKQEQEPTAEEEPI